jgi:hypothetical protein
VGKYRLCPEIGLKVDPESIVWEIFREGKAVNLAEAPALEKRPHSLAEPAAIKATCCAQLCFEFLSGAENANKGQDEQCNDRVV